MRGTIFSTVILFMALSVSANEGNEGNEGTEYSVYFLKKHDTISEILWKKNVGKLYGPDGLVTKTLELNRLSDGSAKKLEKGVPVILPITSEKIMATQQRFDEVSKKYSALLLKGVNNNSYDLKRHNVKVFADYFYRNIKLKNNLGAKSLQNFGVGTSYNGRYLFDYQGFAFSPKASGYLYTQNSVEFEGQESLDANFKPSYTVKLGFNASHEKVPVNLGVFNEFQRMSFVTVENDEYMVVRKSVNYAGFNINHERFFMDRLWTADLNLGHNFTNAWKWDLAFGTQLNRDFDVSLFYESLHDENELMDEIQSSGVRLIYRL